MSALTIQLFDTSRVILTTAIESPTEEERNIPFTNSPLDNFRGSNQNLAVLVGDGSPNTKAKQQTKGDKQ
jgi:hypothetical protein